jgi:predicted ATPase
LCLGYIEQARSLRLQSLAEARRISPFNLAYTLSMTSYADWSEGIHSAATMVKSADEILAISGERGFPLWLGFGNIMLGWSLSTAGQAGEGIPLLLKGLNTYCSSGAKMMVPFFLTMLAEVYGIAAQPEPGLDRLAEAAELVEQTQERWAEAEMHRFRGTLLLSMHQPAAAEDSYRQALTVAQQQSARFWELRAAISLARLWRDQGRRTGARDLLAPIYGWFTEGLDTPVLQDAKALLDQLA